MKKTLVAVAAMAAVTGAMADATISGNIDQGYVSTKIGTLSKTTDINGSGYGAGTLSDTFITISGSEDLGGGMKASFKVEPRLDPNAAAHTMTNREAYVGLAGGFGDVKIGANYTPIFNLVYAMTDVGGVSNAIGMAAVTAGTTTIGAGQSSINYTLPSLATGLSIQALMKKGGAETVNNNVATTYDTDGTLLDAGKGQGDGTGFAASYNIGALTVGYGTETSKNTRLSYGSSLFAATQVAAASTTNSLKVTGAGIAYNAGFATLTFYNGKAALGTASIKTNSYGISVPFGATTVAYGSTDQKSNAGGTATDVKYGSSQMTVSYALSKRTKAYFINGTLNDKTNNVKATQTGFGVAHSF